MRGVDVVALVQLALHPRQANQHSEILPHISTRQFACLAHAFCGAHLRARTLAAFDTQHPRSFHGVEVLGEAAAVGAQEVALHDQHEQRVDFIEGVEDGQEVAWVAWCGDGEEVAQRWGEQGGELLLGEELEEGGFEVVDAGLEGREELHLDGRVLLKKAH